MLKDAALEVEIEAVEAGRDTVWLPGFRESSLKTFAGSRDASLGGICVPRL